MSWLTGWRAGGGRLLGGSVVQVAASVSALCTLGSSAAAQIEGPLSAGTKVRVVTTAADGRARHYVTGTLIRLTADTVTIVPGGVFSLNEGTYLERFVRTRDHRVGGGVIGAASGALTGAVIGAATWRPCRETGWFACFMKPTKDSQTAIGAIMGAFVGAGMGWSIGRSIETDTWQRVGAGSVRLTLGPGAAGVRLTF